MRLQYSKYLFCFVIVLFVFGCNSEINNDSIQTGSDSTGVEESMEVHDSIGESAATTDRVAAIQERLRESQESVDLESNVQRYRLDVAPYNRLLNSEGYLDLKGRSMKEIDEILGESPIIVRQSVKGAPLRREVRVYLPYQEDSTGLYLFFQNETIIEFKMDEFNGILQSGILDYMK